MESIYCRIDIRWKRQQYYFLWLGSEEVRLIQDEEGRLILFESIHCLEQYVGQRGFLLDREGVYDYNFDEIKNWAHQLTDEIDLGKVLNTWNMLDDVLSALRIPFEGNKQDALSKQIYDKLFAGNNLPSIKPADEADYIPIWTGVEKSRINKIFSSGFRLFDIHSSVEKCI